MQGVLEIVQVDKKDEPCFEVWLRRTMLAPEPSRKITIEGIEGIKLFVFFKRRSAISESILLYTNVKMLKSKNENKPVKNVADKTVRKET